MRALASLVFGCFMVCGFFFCGCTAALRADIQLRSGNFEEAIGLFEQHLEENPDDVRARRMLGFACLKANRLEQAARSLETAHAAAPGNPDTIFYLGLTYLKLERIDDAIAIWQQYRNKKQALLEREVRRQLTLLLMARGRREARVALANEAMHKGVETVPDSVAVCNYRDLSPDKRLGSFERALVAMVISDLSNIQSIKVIERVRLQALLQEMELGQTGLLEASSAPRVGHLAGAENVVTGNLSLGSIKTVTAMGGKHSGSLATTVSQDRFFELPARIVAVIAEMMGASLSGTEQEAVGRVHTTVYDAMIRYGDGLEALDRGRWQDAVNLFAQAVDLDPAFRMARDAREGTPRSSSPTIEALGTLSAAQLAEHAERDMATARDDQQKADQRIEEMKRAGKCTG